MTTTDGDTTNTTPTTTPRVDVVFRVVGNEIAVDHGYALFAAIASALDEDLHGCTWLAIAGFRGFSLTKSTLGLRGRDAELRLRVPCDRLAWTQALVGKTLDIQGQSVVVGVSRTYELQPSAKLQSRIVTTKVVGDLRDSELFRKGIAARLAELSVAGRIELGDRRVVRIAGKTVAGYQLKVHELSDVDSLKLQYLGVGGRRRFGCGILMAPAREDRQ